MQINTGTVPKASEELFGVPGGVVVSDITLQTKLVHLHTKLAL